MGVDTHSENIYWLVNDGATLNTRLRCWDSSVSCGGQAGSGHKRKVGRVNVGRGRRRGEARARGRGHPGAEREANRDIWRKEGMGDGCGNGPAVGRGHSLGVLSRGLGIMTPVTGVVSASFSGKLFLGGAAILVCGSGNQLGAAKLNLGIVSTSRTFLPTHLRRRVRV